MVRWHVTGPPPPAAMRGVHVHGCFERAARWTTSVWTLVRGHSTYTSDPSIRRRGRGFDMHGANEGEGVKSQGFEQLDVDMDQADDDAPVAGHANAAQCTFALLTRQLWKAG